MSSIAKQSITLRRSPIVFVRNILAVELGAFLLFLAAQPLAFYKELYTIHVQSRFFSLDYELVAMALVALFEVAATLYIFLRWYGETYRIDAKNVSFHSGVLNRSQTIVNIADLNAATVGQGLIGKFRGYGTVTMHLAGSGDTIELCDIAEPFHYAELLMEYKHHVSRGNKGSAASPPALDIVSVLEGNEHESVEFKSTFRWDIRAGKVNKDLEKAVMKTIAAFLNSQGGYLVIGIDDAKDVVGVHHDYATLSRKDADGFENHFTLVFKSVIGPEFRQYVTLQFHPHGDKEICMVTVSPAKKPAYFTLDGKEEFYIRTGNTTTSLTFREANAYVSSRRSK